MSTFGAHQFLSTYQGVDLAEVKAVWVKELSRLTPQQIARGLDRLSTCKFCPNIAEFMRLCRPPIDHEALFSEAARGEFRLQATWVAARQFGYFMLRTSSWAASKARWTDLLDEALEEFGNQPYFPEPVQALPPPAPIKPDEVRIARERMREILANAGTPKPGKQWAEKILARAANGEVMTAIQIEMAARALGIDHRTIHYSGAAQNARR